jgi:hypothetical protein
VIEQWAHIWYRPIVTQPQLFGFGRSLRKSLNSPGPFRRRRFRCCRSSAVAEGSISLSICSPASSNAFAAALGLRCRVGCVPDNPNSASLRIASGRETGALLLGPPSIHCGQETFVTSQEHWNTYSCCRRLPGPRLRVAFFAITDPYELSCPVSLVPLVRQINGHEQRTADAPGWLSGLLGLTVPPTLLAHADEVIEQLIKQSSSTAAMHTANKVGVCRQAANGMRAKR